MKPSTPLAIAALLLALPRVGGADAQSDAPGDGSVLSDAAGRVAAGDVAGLFGERARGDPGALNAAAAPRVALGASANIPGGGPTRGSQMPRDFDLYASPPPAPPASADGSGPRSGSALADVAAAPLDPTAKPLPNPSFSRPACAPGQPPPCPMQVMTLRENTPDGVKNLPITNFVDYGAVEGSVFRQRRWWEFWKDPISVSATDIHQGGLGDCFLLASLAAIANKQPDVLLHMIKQETTTQTAWVQFFDGRPLAPLMVGPVDNLFPVWKEGRRNGGQDVSGQPVFAQPVGGSRAPIWPLVVEKAYAQKFRSGSYADLNEGGFSGDAMEHITGQPSHWFILQRGSQLDGRVDLQQLIQWDQSGQPITIGTRNPPPEGCASVGAAAPVADAPKPAQDAAGGLAGTVPSPGADVPAPGEPAAAKDPNAPIPFCEDPLYQGAIACKPGSDDPVCRAPVGTRVRLATSHAYWVKEVDAGSGVVTLANPWGADQPTVRWPWSRLEKSLYIVYVNDKKN